jgi:hypothetical protein
MKSHSYLRLTVYGNPDPPAAKERRKERKGTNEKTLKQQEEEEGKCLCPRKSVCIQRHRKCFCRPMRNVPLLPKNPSQQ